MPRLRRYPFLQANDGVNWKGVNPKLLAALNRLGMELGKVITIISGRRSEAEQQYLWDHAEELGLVRGKTVAEPGKSQHQYGAAVDATIDGEALGDAVSSRTLAKHGLRTLAGDAPHTFLVGAKGKPVEPGPPPDEPEEAPVPVGASAGIAPPAQTVAMPPQPEQLGANLYAPGALAPGSPSSRQIAESWRILVSDPDPAPEVASFFELAQMAGGEG